MTPRLHKNHLIQKFENSARQARQNSLQLICDLKNTANFKKALPNFEESTDSITRFVLTWHRFFTTATHPQKRLLPYHSISRKKALP